MRDNHRPRIAPNGPVNRPLTPKQEAAALALAAGRTLAEAAHESGAGQRTIKTWTATVPAFSRRVTELRGEMTSQALGQLTAGMALAANTLRELLQAASEMVRLSAARAVIELAGKLRESTVFEERLAALEQVAEQNARGTNRRTA